MFPVDCIDPERVADSGGEAYTGLFGRGGNDSDIGVMAEGFPEVFDPFCGDTVVVCDEDMWAFHMDEPWLSF